MKRAKIPLSMTGDNLYGFKCDCTGRNVCYAICQHTVHAYKDKRLKGFEDCRAAIDARTCPAIKMMLAEKKAGKALFFESYIALVEAREKREAERVESERLSKRRRTPIIATSQTARSEEEIRKRDAAIEAKFRDSAEDDVKVRIKRSRQPATDELMDGGNLFAEVVNELTKAESA